MLVCLSVDIVVFLDVPVLLVVLKVVNVLNRINYRKYNAYEGTLGFIVSTNRAKIRNHSDKLAKIRFLMMPENEHLQNEYYQIL